MDVTSLPCVWLTTLRPDGSPHTAPVWFVLDGDTMYVATSASTAKVRNLRRDSRVSVALDQTGPDPRVGEGTAVLHDPIDREVWAETLARFADKYAGWDAADPSLYGPRVLVEIALGRWLLAGSDAST